MPKSAVPPGQGKKRKTTNANPAAPSQPEPKAARKDDAPAAPSSLLQLTPPAVVGSIGPASLSPVLPPPANASSPASPLPSSPAAPTRSPAEKQSPAPDIRHNTVASLSDPPTSAGTTPNKPNTQRRGPGEAYAWLAVKTPAKDKRWLSDISDPALAFDLQRAYRELVRRSPADQLVKEQLDAKVAPVWAHYNKQDDKELHARWLDAKYRNNSTTRTRCRKELLAEFNLAGLKSGELTDAAKATLASRVLLQPGELQPTKGELRYVEHIFQEWCNPDTRPTCIKDLEVHKSLAERPRRGRRSKPKITMARTASESASDIATAAAAASDSGGDKENQGDDSSSE